MTQSGHGTSLTPTKAGPWEKSGHHTRIVECLMMMEIIICSAIARFTEPPVMGERPTAIQETLICLLLIPLCPISLIGLEVEQVSSAQYY
jgi:hypothetical protein